MDINEGENKEPDDSFIKGSCSGRGAVNSTILDYYKKFGRKRDLEQYFSLSTAQSEIRDPSSVFWRRMKAQNESSDSGDKKSESPTELCKISIRFPEASSSQDENTKTKSDSESPPIVTDVIDKKDSDNESVKSDDNNSQKSVDNTFDTSFNKPHSPTSSVTSQRKLEWDSLADVGYANESDRKNSGSSLSTLERLALKQQYNNNDSKNENQLGNPGAHSTLIIDSSNSKTGKGLMKKTTRVQNKDIDFVELNLPQTSANQNQSISVNLTKHISFNVEKDGGVTFENIKKDVKITPEKVSGEAPTPLQLKMNKDVQTSLTRPDNISLSHSSKPSSSAVLHGVPVFISVNTLKRRQKKRKVRNLRKKRQSRKAQHDNEKENIPLQEKSGEPVSEAESFEYMPGHIYNQNQLKDKSPKSFVGNKSSLESSGVLTTDSSKGSKHSFTKDLEKSINLLKTVLKKHNNDSSVKDKLIKDVVQRLINSKYRDDKSRNVFLSNLNYNSKRIGLNDSHYTTTTSTSDANTTHETKRPKKSILRSDNYNPNAIAHSSQSAPNLPSVSQSDIQFAQTATKSATQSNTDSDRSSKKHSSDAGVSKTSSEELYKKYIEAVMREENYKRHLKHKEIFMKQKLVSSDTAIKVRTAEIQANKRLQDLLIDLTRNNYADGSGDASQLEGGASSCSNINKTNHNFPRPHKTHSPFTLSSENSDCNNKRSNLKHALLKEIAQTSKSHKQEKRCTYGKSSEVAVVDTSVQVSLQCNCDKCTVNLVPKQDVKEIACVIPGSLSNNIKYVCLCSNQNIIAQEAPENFLLYKCSRLSKAAVLPDHTTSSPNIISLDECAVTKPHSNACTKISKACQTDANFQIDCLQRNYKFQNTSDAAPIFSDNLIKYTVSEPQSANNSTKEMQTEISINPRLINPVTDDGDYISDPACATIVNKKCKLSTLTDAPINDKMLSNKLASIHKQENTFNENKASESVEPDNQSHKFDRNTDVSASCKVEGDNFTIPIHGTNMAVMVSISSSSVQMPNHKLIEVAHQRENTNSINDFVKTSSHAEGCLKLTQHKNVGETENIIVTSSFARPNGHTDSKETDEGYTNNQIKFTNKSIISSSNTEVKSETYPKNQPATKPRVIMRSNTDTGNMSMVCTKGDFLTPFQTEKSYKNGSTNCGSSLNTKDRGTQHSASETSKSSSKSTKYEDFEKYHKIERKLSESDKSISSHKSNKSTNSSDREKETLCGGSKKAKSTASKSLSSGLTSEDWVNAVDTVKPPKCDSSEDQKDLTSNDTHRTLKTAKNSINEDNSEKNGSKDNIIKLIQNITERYSKANLEKSQKKKCFKEIIGLLNYFLDTEDGSDNEQKIKENFTDFSAKNDAQKESKIRESNSKSKESETSSSTSKNRECEDEKSSSSNRAKSKSYNNSDKVPKTDTKNIHEHKCFNQKKNSPAKKLCKSCQKLEVMEKCIQYYAYKAGSNKICDDKSSTPPVSTEIRSTSSESATTNKVIHKIRKECDKYHNKRSRLYVGSKCEVLCETPICCDHCKRSHCFCKAHKCRPYKPKGKTDLVKKPCVAYNLIIQTSDSLASEDTFCQSVPDPLKSIIVKVPPNYKHKYDKIPFKEVSAKIEKKMPHVINNNINESYVSKDYNESDFSTTEDNNKKQGRGLTVRDYLEKNRPDFVENSSQRQDCLKLIKNCRTNDRASKYEVLSMQAQQSPLRALSENDLLQFAKHFGADLRKKKVPSKFINEREMKQHSEKIFNSLPEVVRKKEQAKKENIKKTNLLMASIFKKNLQKKTLRGAVNLSNYSPIIKI